MHTRRTRLWLACLLLTACGGDSDPSDAGKTPAREEVQRVHVEDVRIDRGGAAVVLLQEIGGELRRLPIWIGGDQARSIFAGLEDIEPPRPNTHDLVLRLLGGAEREISRVIVTELQGSTYYAVIELSGSPPLRIDSRPSDAIAIAVRAGTPIFVAERVLRERRPGLKDGDSLDVRLESPSNVPGSTDALSIEPVDA